MAMTGNGPDRPGPGPSCGNWLQPASDAGILAGMTSLASLTHAAAAAPAFNSTFYAVAATVIPVLFLAVAVQGRGYKNLMKALDVMDQGSDPDIPLAKADAAIFAATAVLVTIATLILAAAVLSEILAVYALYQQQARSTTGQTVIISVILLTIATATGPALTFLSYYIRSSERHLRRTRLKAINTAAVRELNPATPSHPDTQDQPGPGPDPGKTDPD
jgi:hypothetical protein